MIRRTLLSLMCCLLCGIGLANAQAEGGDIAAGAQLSYGCGVESMGIGARFMYNPIDHLRTGVEVNYFIKRKYQSMVDVALNAQYLFALAGNRLFLYPELGLCFASFSVDAKGIAKALYDLTGTVGVPVSNQTTNKFGMNLGAGAQWQFNEHIGISAEYRHTIMKSIDQGVFSLGFIYKF